MTVLPDLAARERPLTQKLPLDWRASFVSMALVLALLPPLTAAVLIRGGEVLWTAGLAALAIAAAAHGASGEDSVVVRYGGRLVMLPTTDPADQP